MKTGAEVLYADASPRKHFFVEMFTRDISLEDCILDLIDNSIDSLIRTQKINVSATILKKQTRLTNPPTIDVHISRDRFEIKDTCGGISNNIALHELFTFGHSNLPSGSQLGVYGIGLKRALFKLGAKIHIESKTKEDGFQTDLDLSEWANNDDITAWKVPLVVTSGSKKLKDAGTTIRVENLRQEVRMVIESGRLIDSLTTLIGKTYALFLDRYVRVRLNDRYLEPKPIPLGESGEIKPAIEKMKLKVEKGTVSVTLISGLAARTQWKAENAGWYVICNGRVVVSADKTDLTGWGIAAMPNYHNKYAGFLGIAYFNSSDPRLLPWTTSKRGLNREARVFLDAKNKMALVSRNVLNFLNKMYPSELAEEPKERIAANQIKPVDTRSVATQQSKPFTVNIPQFKPKAFLNIQYDAKVSDIDKIKKHLRKPSMSASRIGRMTFDHFIKTECPE